MFFGFSELVLIGIVVVAASSLLVPAERIAAATTTTPAGRALVERFVGRSRRFRTVGGIVGIAVSLVVVSIRTDSTDVTIGFLPALAGAVIGSIVAESFRIRRTRGPRSASLEPRADSDYGDEVADRREMIVGGAWLLATGMGILQVDATTLGLGLIVAAITAVRRWAQRRIALRGRPALDPDLSRADDEVRRMAVRHGIARPSVTLMTLLVAGQTAALQVHHPEASGMRNLLGIVSLVLTGTALVWWWTNRNFGFSASDARRGRTAAIALGVVFGLMVVFVLLARVGG